MRKQVFPWVFVLVFCLLTAGLTSYVAWGQPWTQSRGGPEDVIFDNGNIYAVFNGPKGQTSFTIQERYQITRITNYHWNFENGAEPGIISIRDAAGNILGRWQATTRPGQGGVPNAYWDVYPDIVLSAGKYTILDSDPSTWSCNAENDNHGMSQVYGYPTR